MPNALFGGGAARRGGGGQSAEGVRFLWLIGLLLFALSVFYARCHQWIPAESRLTDPAKLVAIDAYGRASIISQEDLDWSVGDPKGVPLVSQMSDRNKEITTRTDALSFQMQALAAAFYRPSTLPIQQAVDGGNFSGAVQLIDELWTRSSPSTLSSSDIDLLIKVRQTLTELKELKVAQLATRNLLRPPEKFILFWSDPQGILVEVIFWALFGVLASLLFHSGVFVRQGRYVPMSITYAFTRIVYTPVIAVVLVLCVTVGILHVSSAGTRIWMIPLFGFLAGFNARKAAAVVSNLSSAVLDKMSGSIGKEDSYAAPGANFLAALPAPKTFGELRTQAQAQLTNLMLENFKPPN